MFKNKVKKHIALFLVAVMVVATASIGMIAYAASIVAAINPINFPDDNFRAVVSDWYDDNSDGYLSSDEASGVTIMSFSYMVDDTCGEDAQIKDLTGINYFTDCKRLRASGLGIEKLPIDKLTNLVELTVQGNELSSIDISHNINLESINCSSNEIATLDASYCTKITKLHAYANKLTSIIFNSALSMTLTNLQIHQNELTELDVTSLTALTDFNCSHNHLRSLDLSQNTNLENITDSFIGSQTLSADAKIENGNIFVSFDVPNWEANLVATTIDTVEETADETITHLAYNGSDFTPADCDDIVNGITYYYNTGLQNAESMSVSLDINRDFWQVKFFTDKDKSTMYSKMLVYTGESAEAPTDIEAPQCKKFAGWSEDFSNVTNDLDVYVIWNDDHNIKPVSFNLGVIYFDCTKCQNQKDEYRFSDYVNMRSDDEFFPTLLDMNNDNIINAKDYAMILNSLE